MHGKWSPKTYTYYYNGNCNVGDWGVISGKVVKIMATSAQGLPAGAMREATRNLSRLATFEEITRTKNTYGV